MSQGFDVAGQRLVSHRAAAGGEALPSYSPEGQLESLGDSGFWFDAAGRLIEVATGTSTSRFDYDGAGNRLRVVRDGVTTRYLHDAGGNVVAEMDGSGAITRYYIHGLGLLGMVQAAGPNAGLYVYHADGTGHVMALTDSAGAVANAYSYGSFGERLDGGAAIRIEQPFTYAGLVGVMAEPAHGLHYMRARYYHVASHRFVNEDPSGFNGGLNLYAYVGGNPLGFVDPSGLAGQEFRNTPTCSCALGHSGVYLGSAVGGLGGFVRAAVPALLPAVQPTKSTLQLGQQMHKAYKADLADDVLRVKEFRFATGRRADFIDFQEGIIYELKPNNPRGIRDGTRQLEQYLQDAREQFPGINWRTVLDTY